jgi:hypothetical protein
MNTINNLQVRELAAARSSEEEMRAQLSELQQTVRKLAALQPGALNSSSNMDITSLVSIKVCKTLEVGYLLQLPVDLGCCIGPSSAW